ncbi:MAG: acetyl-CoA acetyltransferase [Thermoprotei archaeon]|nr:MAG: acetyl-CoA acetyltransferase [Thermoprotei archaeon]
MPKIYIVGASLTKIDRHFDKSIKDLVSEVYDSLISNLKEDSIDAVVVSSALSGVIYNQLNLASIITDYLQLKDLSVYNVELGEASGASAIHIAFSLVRSGIHKSVLVIGVDKLSEYPTWKANRLYSMVLDSEIDYHYGISPVNYAALLTKLYMKRYGYSRNDLTYWPVLMHQNATKVPHAQLRFPISPQKALSGLTMSEPLTIYDTWPIGDGAAALLIANEDIARKYSDELVELAGIGSSGSDLGIPSRDDPLYFPNTYRAFRRALSMANIDGKGLRTYEIHDNYTISAILTLEALGLTERGGGCRFVKELSSGNVGLGINLSGGLKARGHPLGATGVYQVAEIYMQLIGKFPISVDAEVGLAHNMTGLDFTTFITILRR